MSAAETTFKSIRVVAFDGKHKNYKKWRARYLAKVSTIEKSVLLGDVEVPPEDEDLDEAADADRIAIRDANKNAYANLLIACEDDVCFNLISTAVSQELPNGDAEMAFTKLKHTFAPTTKVEKMTLKKQFYNCKLKTKKIF